MARFASLWSQPALSQIEHLCIRSFLAHGHAFELYAYEPDLDVPDGCTVLDANQILDRDQIFTYRTGPEKGSYGAFANLFRYKLLLERGGWWVDLDVVCLSSVVADAEVQLAREDEKLVCNAILRFPAGHPCMEAAYDRATAAGRNMRWTKTGPRLISELVTSHSLTQYLVPTESFYPLHWSEFTSLIRPDHCDRVRDRVANATFLHLWNEMFRRTGYNKDYRPPRGSYLERLFAHYAMARRFHMEYVLLGGEPLRLGVVPIGGGLHSGPGAEAADAHRSVQVGGIGGDS